MTIMLDTSQLIIHTNAHSYKETTHHLLALPSAVRHTKHIFSFFSEGFAKVIEAGEVPASAAR